MPEKFNFSPDVEKNSGRRSKAEKTPEQERREREEVLKKPVVPRGSRLKTTGATWAKVAALSGMLHGAGLEAAADFPVTKSIVQTVKKNGHEAGYGLVQEASATEHADGLANEAGLFGSKFSGRVPGPEALLGGILLAQEQEKFFYNDAWGIKGIQLEKGPHGELRLDKDAYWRVDFSKFFLTHEFRRGTVSADDARRIQHEFAAQVRVYNQYYVQLSKEAQKNSGEVDWQDIYLKVAHRIMSDQGDYDPDQPLFSRVMDSSGAPQTRVGDCKARVKRGLAFMVEIFTSWSQEDVELLVEVSGDPHVRLIMRYKDAWYVAEDGVRPLAPEEIPGRVFVSPNNFFASELNLEKQAMLPPSHEAPDQAGPDGVDDGFNLLPPGVRPTKNAFGGVPVRSQAQKFAPKTFAEMQAAYRPSTPDLEVTFIDLPDKVAAENARQTVSEFAPRAVRLKDYEIATAQMTGRLKAVGEEISNLFQRPDEDDHEGRARYDRFMALSPGERLRFVRESTVDLSPLNDVPLYELAIDGGSADLGQLKNWKNIRTVMVSDRAYVRGLEHLSQGKNIESLLWDGKSYLAHEVIGAQKAFEAAVPQMNSLTSLTLENAPISDLRALRSSSLESLSLDNLAIKDVSFIAALPKLKKLVLSQIAATDLLPIKPLIEKSIPIEGQMYDRRGVLNGGLMVGIIKQQNYQVRFQPPDFNLK